MTFAIGAAKTSFEASLERDLATRGAGDVLIFANQPFAPADIDRVQATPGVARVTPLGFGQTTITSGKGRFKVRINFVDPASYFDVQSFPWADGDDRSARAGLASGGSMIVTQATAAKLGLQRGAHAALDTTEGRRTFTVAGTFATIEVGDIVVVGASDGAALFNATAPLGMAAKVKPGASPATVRAAVRAEFDAAHRVGFDVQLGSERRDQGRAQLRQYFVVFTALILVAAVVGLLGLANTLAMSVVMRTREIGILRAVGAQRRQVRALVVVEAATLSGVALFLALPLGWLLSVALIRSSTAAIGVTVALVYPWPMIAVVAAMAVAMALVASVAPARRAAKVDPVSALRFD